MITLSLVYSASVFVLMQDPLQPFVLYWKRNVIPGMGIFIAGYVLFSITNIHTLFQDAYQPCWGT